MVSNWSRTRFCVPGVLESSSTVPMTAATEVSFCSRPESYHPLRFLTFRLAAEQDINSTENLHRFVNSCAAATDGAAIAADRTDAVLPALAVFSSALAFANELAEFGASVVVFDFVRRQASDNVVAVREELSSETHCERRQRSRQKPCARGVVGGCRRRRAVSHGNNEEVANKAISYLTTRSDGEQ